MNLKGAAEYIRTGYPPGDYVREFASAAMERIETLERQLEEAREAYRAARKYA